jgi:hypothetical protein
MLNLRNQIVSVFWNGANDDVVHRNNPDQLAGFIDDKQPADFPLWPSFSKQPAHRRRDGSWRTLEVKRLVQAGRTP